MASINSFLLCSLRAPMAMATLTSQSSLPRPRPCPRLSPLRSQDLQRLLPWTGSGPLVVHEFGEPMDWAVRLSVSLASAVSVYRYSSTMAALASLFWLWAPMWSVALRSCQLRLSFPYAGVWRAKVVAVKSIRQSFSRPANTPLQEFFRNLRPSRSLLRILIGDDSPASLQIEVPMSNKTMRVKVGELAEVLVLSDRRDLSRFKAMRDVYVPRLGIWISQNPCIEKTAFEALSVALNSQSAPGLGDSPLAQDYSQKGCIYSVPYSLEDKRPLLDMFKAQNLWMSKEPRVWEMPNDLDWERPDEREEGQQSNRSAIWRLPGDE